MIKDSTDIMPIILWIGDWINVERELLQNYKHASTKNEQILKATLTSEVSSNMEVTAIDYDVYISPNETKIVDWQQIWKHLPRLTCAQYVMCHFPLKMDLLGVIIVIMFQHKMHVNRKHIWDHPYLKTMINQNYTSFFSIQ